MKYLLILSTSVPFAVAQNIVNLFDWSYDYSPQNVEYASPIDLTISYTPVALRDGARIKGPLAQSQGTFCGDIILPQISGVIFSFYLSSGEPANRAKDKWDELDFEWPYPQASQNNTWINSFHNGIDIIPTNNAISVLPYPIYGRYCINWNIGPGGVANWYIDGQLLYTLSLDTWVKPLKPYITLWGVLPSRASDGLTAWSGLNHMKTNQTVYAQANNLYLSATQEDIPLTGPQNRQKYNYTIPKSCFLNYAAGCQVNDPFACCPGLQCTQLNGYTQCLEPKLYTIIKDNCYLTQYDTGCNTNGQCCNPFAKCIGSLCILPKTWITAAPTSAPVTASPTLTFEPTAPTVIPTVEPTITPTTGEPTVSFNPTIQPSITPSYRPSRHPSSKPSMHPTPLIPSKSPVVPVPAVDTSLSAPVIITIAMCLIAFAILGAFSLRCIAKHGLNITDYSKVVTQTFSSKPLKSSCHLDSLNSEKSDTHASFTATNSSTYNKISSNNILKQLRRSSLTVFSVNLSDDEEDNGRARANSRHSGNDGSFHAGNRTSLAPQTFMNSSFADYDEVV